MVTAHPLARLPIFLMGMLSGLQVLRANSKWEDFEDPNLSNNLLQTLQPWKCGRTLFNSRGKEGTISIRKPSKEESITIWRKRVDFNAFIYTGFLTALIVAQVVLDAKYGYLGEGRLYI